MEPSETKQPPGTPPQPAGFPVPVPVIAGAILAGALAVGAAWSFMRKPNVPVAPTAGDSTAATDTALDVQWQTGRPSGSDCVGTFLIAHGAGTRTHFVAMAMDANQKEIARDSADVAAAKPGTTFDVRFAGVKCDAIKDWQLQAATPKQ
jgi:hypothetical protein